MFRSGLGWAIFWGLVGLSRVAGATTVPGGSLSADTVWTAANSPYLVQGDLTVPSGKTLTIQPGVEVQFVQGDSLTAGQDQARTELTVNGTLLAQGSVASPIVLHASGSTATSVWYGVVAGATASSVVLTHVDIENALRGVENDAPASVLALSSSLLRYNYFAIWLQNGNITLDSLLISNGFTGVQAVTQAAADVTFLLQNSLVSSNAQNGVALVGTTGHTVQATIENSTFNATPIGIKASGQSAGQATLTIRNSIVSSCAVLGVVVDTGASATITYSDFWGNGLDFANATAGTGCVSVDPLFAAPPANLQLTATSPCRDIGSATSAPNHDYLGAPRPQGTGFDLGAYEYPVAGGGAGGAGGGAGGGGAGGRSAGGGGASGGAGAAGRGGTGGTSAGAGGASGAGVAGTAGNAGGVNTGLGGAPSSGGASASASGAANQAGNSASAGASAALGSAGESSTAGMAPSSSKSDSGCGCTVAGSRPNDGLWLSLGALALFALKRRKRA